MRFTVFTPTFNRAHTINRVFESLEKQTFRDFEWVIIDDGSSDDTEKLVSKWKENSFFPVIYKKQNNQGKHVAINRGLELASGYFFLIADSDDEFVPHSLEVFNRAWENIEPSMQKNFTGVTALCMDDQGQIIGDRYPNSPYDSNPADTFYLLGIRGEKWGFHRTEVLKDFKFPELKGYKFFPEGLVWNKIGRKYTTRYLNIPLRYYSNDSGNQLTQRSAKETSPMYIFYAQALNEDSDYLFNSPITFLKIGAQGSRFSFHQSQSLMKQISLLRLKRIKALWLLATPIGFALYIADILGVRKL